MFQSVLEQQEWSARRLGTGAGVSLLVHAGIFAAALVLSAGVAQEVEDVPREIVFRRPPPKGTPVQLATQPEPEPEPLDYHPDARPDGIGAAVPCLKCIIDENAPVTAVEPAREEVVPFVSGNMTPPQLRSGASLQYTREALAAGVEGILIARCVITREGDVENCKILKGQPHMNEAVLSALETRRYTPVMYQGRAISVIYNFHINLNLPR
ncbi:MAG TPA: TonB family protein [Hyalangium sp.]|nr:TonB family protein [Hyalangium sp.]